MNVIEKMSEIVEKYVKYFSSNFYDLDVKTIGRCYPDQHLVWVVREHGTWLFASCKYLSKELQDMCMKNFEYYKSLPDARFYEVITGKSVKKISSAKARRILTA